MPDYHLVEVDVWGPGDLTTGRAFHVHTLRKNPADLNRVTGSATYASFLSSMLGMCSMSLCALSVLCKN